MVKKIWAPLRVFNCFEYPSLIEVHFEFIAENGEVILRDSEKFKMLNMKKYVFRRSRFDEFAISHFFKAKFMKVRKDYTKNLLLKNRRQRVVKLVDGHQVTGEYIVSCRVSFVDVVEWKPASYQDYLKNGVEL